MACPAAIAAVRATLSTRLVPPRVQTADEIFETINWWTKETICEAIADLIVNGECEQHKADDGTMTFRPRTQIEPAPQEPLPKPTKTPGLTPAVTVPYLAPGKRHLRDILAEAVRNTAAMKPPEDK